MMGEMAVAAQELSLQTCHQQSDGGHIIRQGGAMRHQSMLVLGLVAIMSVSPARPLARQQRTTSNDDQVSTSHGIETQKVEGGVLKIDVTGKGAVLCSWQIIQVVRGIGLECHKGKDVAFQTELRQSIDRIESFIVANSKVVVKRSDLATQKMEGLKQLQSSGNFCAGDAARIYDAMRIGGATALRAQTSELLSIPREPVLNPCL